MSFDNTCIVIPNKNHQVKRSGSILLPASDRDGRTTEINWNDYKFLAESFPEDIATWLTGKEISD